MLFARSLVNEVALFGGCIGQSSWRPLPDGQDAEGPINQLPFPATCAARRSETSWSRVAGETVCAQAQHCPSATQNDHAGRTHQLREDERHDRLDVVPVVRIKKALGAALPAQHRGQMRFRISRRVACAHPDKPVAN